MKILVVGGAGQVGAAVATSTAERHEVHVLPRAALDITDRDAVRRTLGDLTPDWLVNGAAYTAVDLAEDEPAKAHHINDTAVEILAAETSRAGCRLFHLSTDFVFDGEANRAYAPDAATRPLSVYGASKLAGEGRALGVAGGIVLRTAWVYASTGKNFVLTMLRLMRERPEVRVVADQIGTPTWATGIATTIGALIEGNAPGGIYHWTDLGVASWYDFAVAIQDEALARGLLERAVPIVPIVSAAYPTKARRPAFSVLDSSATRTQIGVAGIHWRHNLRTMLDELRAA